MSDTYNLYNLEAPFKEYLLAEIKPASFDKIPKYNRAMTDVTVKNYLSDIRHFFGWTMLYLKHVVLKKDEHGGSLLQQFITTNVILEYKSYLSENSIPNKTINRRLSTVRKFCSFCISQGWLKENPAKKISNIKYSPFIKASYDKQISSKNILDQFGQDLSKEFTNQDTVINYLDDVSEFLRLA